MAGLNLIDNIPILNKSAILQAYKRKLKESDIKLDPLLYLLICFAISVAVALVLGLVLPVLSSMMLPKMLLDVGESISVVLPVLVFIAGLNILAGYPITKSAQRLDLIEGALADALKQMADTLKAGGTYEYALREVAESELGPLATEMNKVLRKLEEGENFENSMKSLAAAVDSRLVARTVTIIVDSVRAGAGLAEILEDIAEDVRETHRVNQERKTRTLMQFLFMVVAGTLVAPFIFGMVSTIITFLIVASSSAGVVSATAKQTAENAKDLIVLLLEAYIFIEILASSLMIALMRDGKVSKAINYFPLLMLLAFVVFFLSRIGSGLMLLPAGGF